MAIAARITASFRLIVTLALVFLIAGCEPAATPLPAYIPITPSASATLDDNAASPSNAPIRYALINLDAIPALLQQDHLVMTQLSAPPDLQSLVTQYDIAMIYGTYTDDQNAWSQTPNTPTVSLVINPTTPPLNDPALAALVREMIDPQALIGALNINGARLAANAPMPEHHTAQAWKTRLANHGLPDGFNLHVTTQDAPGARNIIDQWQTNGIRAIDANADDPITAFANTHIHASIITWTAPETRAAWENIAAEANVIDLYTVPVSYWIADHITVTLADNGIPLPTLITP